MKKRWIIAAVAYAVIVALVLPVLATNVHYVFLGEYVALTVRPTESWQMIIRGGQPLQLFIILTGAVTLILFWILFTGTYLNYRSNMLEITPDIHTPCADGQGQFGTAQWLKPEQICKFFGVWVIPKKTTELQNLLAAGKKDQEEIRKANVQLD